MPIPSAGTHPSNPRVLVTGATGLVGSRLCARLAASGAHVLGLSRRPEAARRAVPALAEAWPLPGSGPLPGGAVHRLDAVVHLAGESVAGRWTEARKQAIEASRIAGTRQLVDSLAAEPADARPRVLVAASAIGYYGETGEREVREDAPPADDFLARVCVGWEAEARRAEALGIRVVSLRIGLVMAKEGGALARMLPLFRAGLGGSIGSGQQYWPWIHIADLVGLVEHALAHDTLSGPVNATAPTPVRQAEFARILGRVLHRPALLPTPAFALRTVLGEFAGEVTGSRKVLPARALESGYAFRFAGLEPALRDLLG
jgi:hypothetical protein